MTADDRTDVAGLTRWYEQTHGTGITQALDQRLVYRETTQFQAVSYTHLTLPTTERV